jgi:hypothetical protein
MTEKELILPGRKVSSVMEVREHFEIISLYSIVTIQEKGYSSKETFQIIPASKKEEGTCKDCDRYVSDLDPLALACMGKHENDTAVVSKEPVEKVEESPLEENSSEERTLLCEFTILNVNNDMQEECLNRS